MPNEPVSLEPQLRRALHALASAFPSEFKSGAMNSVREGVAAKGKRIADWLPGSRLGQLTVAIAKQLKSELRKLDTVENPLRLSEIQAEIDKLMGHQARVKKLYQDLCNDAQVKERNSILAEAAVKRAAAASRLVDLMTGDDVRAALAMFVIAEMQLAVCGEDVSQFIANKAAMLATE